MKRYRVWICAALLSLAAAAVGGEAPVATATGEAAPELSGAWTKGTPVTLAELRGKKFAVLYFWTVNQRSLEDIPRMAEAVRKFADKPVAFVGVGCDEIPKVTGFFRVKDLAMPILADDKFEIMRKYLRPTDRLPLAAVVDKEGRLAWRGASAELPAALEKMLDGKFDLKEFIRREKFSAAVSAAIAREHYEEAVKLLDGELAGHPGNVELVSAKANLLARGLKDPAAAIKAVDEGLAHSPRSAALYDLKLKLLRSSGKHDAIPECLDRLCAAFAEQPLVLMGFAEKEMALMFREGSPEFYSKLMTAAYRGPKFRDDRERGMVNLAYARMLYFCGCPEKAAAEAERAAKLLKTGPEHEEAQAMARFFSGVADLAKKLGR